MMKRYHHEPYNGIREHPEGELVEWEDHVVEITRLKELNREMVEVLSLILNANISMDRVAYVDIMVHKAVVERGNALLAKADGSGE